MDTSQGQASGVDAVLSRCPGTFSCAIGRDQSSETVFASLEGFYVPGVCQASLSSSIAANSSDFTCFASTDEVE